ncbi:MAG: NERD domain-containing protein [Sandarakinorhabdus sp.]|jgi:hypothetical protein|nr:NERD domain-containing protein [Sandarakinorhabdus sp.]
MILKPREDRAASIAALERLMAHPAATRHDIERLRQQIDAIIKGDLSESKAAIELDTHYGDRKGTMIIHDLRIEVDGLVAQIDHVLVNRFLDVWVLESKRLANGIKVQDNGECLTFNGRYPVAIDSPIEQNRRHVRMLERLFASGAVTLPKRLGITLKPRLRSLVLIAEGRISRPKLAVPGIESLIRTDQLVAHIERESDSRSGLDMARVLGLETVQEIGRQLVAQHRPIEFDWERRFGLPSQQPRAAPEPPPPVAVEAAIGASNIVQLHPPTMLPQTAMTAAGQVTTAEATAPAKPRPPAGQCDACEAPISAGVKSYCRKNAARFDNRILCMSCQPRAVASA